MTDKEKLQRLFDAALKDTSEVDKAPTRSFPKNSLLLEPAGAIFEAAPTFTPASPALAAVPVAQATATAVEAPAAPGPNLGLDEASSSELAALLDDQNKRKSEKIRRDLLVTLAICFALCGGGFSWFVHSPDRVQAFQEAIKEIRSAGDIASLLSKYQKAVDKIGARSQQIDLATTAMGMDTELKAGEDANMEAEMQALSGGEGQTTGQRDKLLREKFSKIVTRPGTAKDERVANVDGTRAGESR